ncbi:hypothetical protein [Atopomonas sediminilitoris]|uniref:hypothetical protein n=1 Tax=Atopomonas sediminilitoris TaxID=2919919 RepID=UPI001F4EC93B|nr:hypothetical protein [Atopomonas sediminilitoris]MCJ8170026.1 hypothetical protein [Atopomonas sediminilitoris]
MLPLRARFFALSCVSLLSATLLTSPSYAAMTELVDDELSDVHGQAFINLSTHSAGGTDFTRINFGLDIETQMNTRKLQLGLYERNGESANTADLDINAFALGTVNDATGEINPFRIKDPYLEVAYRGSKMIGVRVGFGEAKGQLSGEINRLTGNVPVFIKGTAQAIYDKADAGQRFLLFLAGVYRSSVIEANAELVSPNGAVDPVRATHSGIRNGSGMECVSGCAGGWTDALLGGFSSQNCAILGIATCFGLNQFQTLPVGDLTRGGMDGAVRDMFISMQTEAVTWKGSSGQPDVNAIVGAFMNLPKYLDANGQLKAPIQLDFGQALNGIPRADTCFGASNGSSAQGGC